MERPFYLGYLKTVDLQRLELIIQRFTKAWENGATAKLAAFLPPASDSLRLIALHELIKIEMEMRWRRGQSAGLDDYLGVFPELGTRRDLSPQLIFEEYRIRSRLGDQPPLATYQKRFPDQFTQLEQMASTLAPPTVPRIDQPSTRSQPTVTSSDPNLIPVVGGYKKIRRLGKGAFGEAWLAEAPGDVEAVLKIIFRPIDHDGAKREQQALDLIKRLHHPFLLQTHAYWVLEDQLIIAMELAECSLRDRLQQCRKEQLTGIPAQELLGYMQQSAEALDYLHSQNVQHRDIKPDNILILKGYAKVADFGLARLLENQSVQVSTGGTPAYMAPEVWRGRANIHSDQYALAATYAELRRGRRLYGTSGGMVEAMVDHLEKPPDLADLDEAEQQVLFKALAKDPTERFETCQAFVRALAEAVFPPPPPPAPEPRPWYRRTDVQIAGAVVFCLLLSLGITVTLRSEPAVLELEISERVVKAGEERTLNLQVRRPGSGGAVRLKAPVRLTFDAPPFVTIPDVEIPVDQDGVAMRVKTEALAATGLTPVKVRAEDAAGRPYQVSDLELDVAAPTTPPGCRQVLGNGVPPPGGKKYYERLTFVMSDDMRIEFILIPRQRPDDPETFYIMENKVWNDLFQKFADARPQTKKPAWKLGGVIGTSSRTSKKLRDLGSTNARWPVLRVDVHSDAHEFARWFGGNLGKLPSAKEWDRAAGRRDKPPGDGPFQGSWQDRWVGAALQSCPAPTLQLGALIQDHVQKNLIAVNRPFEGPLPVGSASWDRSPFGCRDMAGNGREWTRTLFTSKDLDEEVPLARSPGPNDYVCTRAQSYRARAPLRFSDLNTDDDFFLKYDQPDPETGLRIVLVPP